MITNLLTCLCVSKKHLFAILISLVTGLLPVHSQIKYMPSNERSDAGMGVDRVARFFTPAYESKACKK